MKYCGTINLKRIGNRVVLTVGASDLSKGLVLKPLFKIRSLHFGTKLKGMEIKKGEGYGWDGKDIVRAKKVGKRWIMTVPVRDNDPKDRKRRFVRGNCYLRTIHNEIYYFDLRKWRVSPRKALSIEGAGAILDMDFEDIPLS